MQALLDKVEAVIRGNGGPMLWDDFIQALEPHEQRRAFDVCRILKDQGKIKRVVARNPDTGEVTFHLESIGG